MYDGHDLQTISYLDWLHASNIEYPQTAGPAAEVTTELHYSPECLNNPETRGEDCFTVKMLYNDLVLEFDGVCKDPQRCTYKEFQAYIASIWYYRGEGVGKTDWADICQA